MSVTGEPVALRPMNLGEIFDRAVTLLVRNWRVFVIIAAIGILPGQLGSAVAAATQNSALSLFSRILIVLSLVTNMATAKVVAQIYAGHQVDWRAPLIAALRAFWTALGAFFMLAFVCVLPAAIVLGIATSTGAFKFTSVGDDIIAGLLLLAGLLAYSVLGVAGSYVIDTIAIEQVGAGDSIGKMFSALFVIRHIGRTMLFGIAVLLVAFGGGLIASWLNIMLQNTFHSLVAGYAVQALLVISTTAFSTVLGTVYYFDVRVRREGLDLELSLRALEPA